MSIGDFWKPARVRRVADRLAALTGVATTGGTLTRLEAGVAAVEERFAAFDRRLGQRHAVTGLPTREPLLVRMDEDGAGTLGGLAFVDFDRLSAFDPSLGERVLIALVDRVTRMLGDRRLVAQVDRAHLAIWFGPEVDAAAATGELAAIGYALGDVIEDGTQNILPEIRTIEARFDGAATTPQALLTRTLAALAIKGGTLAVTATASVADPAEATRERYLMEQDLRQAIARDEFELHLQPLIDAGRGRVCGAEALLRWRHPRRGTVPPSRFIPVVEAMGLADEVGLWALNAAAREAHGWRKDGLDSLRIAVNISAHQLQRADMGVLVERTLARHSLSPDCLELELTESVATGDPLRTAVLFDSLRTLGVRIAIDDFGTGFSSFSALRSLRFDKIKIDREFVTAVDTRRDSQAICQSIIALGRGLGIRVLAEGVETRHEYRWLRAHGCTHFQGYHFSAPLDRTGFVQFVRDAGRLRDLLALDPHTAQTRLTQRLTA